MNFTKDMRLSEILIALLTSLLVHFSYLSPSHVVLMRCNIYQ